MPELRLSRVTGPPLARAFGALVVGRDARCDVVLNDDAASRRHCRFELAPDGWIVEDLGSSNGTFRNGQRVERAVLRTNDVVRVGSEIFKVEVFQGGDDRTLRLPPDPEREPEPPARLYHVSRSGATFGPFDEAALVARLQTGETRASDVVWSEGFSAWTPLKDVPELRASLPPAFDPSPALRAVPVTTTVPSVERRLPGILSTILESVRGVFRPRR